MLRGTNNLFHQRPWPTSLPNCIDRAGVHSSSGGYIGRKRDISALLSYRLFFIYFVYGVLMAIAFIIYHMGVKSRGVGNVVKRGKRVRTCVPLRGCACTGVCAPAHTR